MPTALIVEDEPEANRLLAMLVQLRGYRTVSAFTGGEALESVVHQHPDIVFLDLMLPDINGYDVCRSLKSHKATSLIPVVMVTARVALENRIRSFDVGAEGYIPKPYTPDQIFRAMSDADTWLRDVDRHDVAGEIRLDSRGQGEPLRQIAQFRNLLFARSALDADAVCRIGVAIEEIAASAETWGRDQGVDVVATLGFHLQSDRVTLSLQDLAGWLDGDLSPEQRWPKSLRAARFDQVDRDADGRRITFLKRFPHIDGHASD